MLSRLLDSADVAREYEERVDIAFHGYDSVRWELYEIPEVRAFVYDLDAKFPYWLHFLTKAGTGLNALAFCFLPPHLTEEAQRTVWPERLGELLERRWIPAMGQLCQQLGYSEEDITRRIHAAMHYFIEGPRLPLDPDTV